MEKTVVFEATSAEECVEGVQRLLPLYRLSEWTVQVGGAERGQHHRAGGTQEVLVPVEVTVLLAIYHKCTVLPRYKYQLKLFLV